MDKISQTRLYNTSRAMKFVMIIIHIMKCDHYHLARSRYLTASLVLRRLIHVW